jgi:HEAT repeat protein
MRWVKRKIPRAVQLVLDALVGPDSELRVPASNSLMIVHDPNTIEPLIAALKDPRADVRQDAVMALFSQIEILA